MDYRESLMALSKASYAGMDVLIRLVGKTEGPEGFFRSKTEKLELIFDELRFNDHLRRTFYDIWKARDVSETESLLKRERIEFITDKDRHYPERLRDVYAPPMFLFVKGNLREYKRGLAVIGSRNCSTYGKEVAVSFSKVLASHGINIISGMARGIDGYAHRGALEGDGFTTAVLGFGIKECYPVENRALKESIAEKGCIVSEYYPTQSGTSYFFPARNRIIAGLADSVLVIEAAQKSGTLITVDFALETGRNIYAIPGRIGDPLSVGCMELIKHGCMPVTSPEDILNDFGFVADNKSRAENTLKLDPRQTAVYSQVEQHPKTTDEIHSGTGLGIVEVLETLASLELLGVVKQPVPGAYIRCI